MKQLAAEPESSDVFPTSLQSPFARLDRAARAGKGSTYYWGTNNYFGLMLPIKRSADAEREDFPEVKAKEWDAAYREELARTSWEQLRGKAFRFCNLATDIARSLERRDASILVPSVGLCAHPWVFAQAEHRVVATDISVTALETVSHPERWPRIYGSAAQDRWDISRLCMYGGTAHPDAFPQMAAIERDEVASELRSRITFAEADWADLPVESGTVDVVFATNALPRDDNRLMERVIAEWRRVLKPNGHLFVLMHNAASTEISAALSRHDWAAVNSFDAASTRPTYRPYYSSG